MTMFLLIGESGEYEQRGEVIMGLFDTRAAADAAVIEYAERSVREAAAWNAFKANVKAEAEANGFPYAYILDDRETARAHYEECARITLAKGGEPAFLWFPERYSIVEMALGELVYIHPEYENERPVTDPSTATHREDD